MKRFDFWFPKSGGVTARKGRRFFVQGKSADFAGVCEIIAVTNDSAALYDAYGRTMCYMCVGSLVSITEYKQGKTPKLQNAKN